MAVGLFNFDTRWTDAKFVRLAYYLPTFEFGSFGCNLEGHLFQNVACATAHGGRLCVDPKAGSLLVLAIMGPFGPDWFLHEADWLSQAPRCSIFASQKKKVQHLRALVCLVAQLGSYGASYACLEACISCSAWFRWWKIAIKPGLRDTGPIRVCAEPSLGKPASAQPGSMLS